MLMFLKLLALGLTAIILIPSGAHFFELAAKIGLGREDYFTVQQIYRGWALFAVPIFAAILANGALFWALRRTDTVAAWSAMASALLIAVTLVIFFIWIFPGNQATDNWTTQPTDWEALRRNWEYGHATNAVIVFIALLLTGRATAVQAVPLT